MMVSCGEVLGKKVLGVLFEVINCRAKHTFKWLLHRIIIFSFLFLKKERSKEIQARMKLHIRARYFN